MGAYTRNRHAHALTIDARKFHHDNLESALNFYAKHHFFDAQVKFLKDGVIHYASTDGGESDDPASWIQSVAKRENAEAVTYVGMARLLSVDGLPCKDDGKILLAGYTSAPGRGTIINLFVLHLEGDNLLISEPEELASLHGKKANLQLVSLKRHKADPLLPDSYR
jgi:hypothetical protein